MQAAGDAATRRQSRFLAVALMAVFAVFSGIVAGLMVATCLATTNLTPPDSSRLGSLRAEMSSNRGSAETRRTLREEDRLVRQVYFTSRRRLRAGAFLLLVGVVAAVCCARWYGSADPALPWPVPLTERTDTDKWLGRRRLALAAAATLAGVLVVGLLAFSVGGGPDLPSADQISAMADRPAQKAETGKAERPKPDAKADAGKGKPAKATHKAGRPKPTPKHAAAPKPSTDHGFKENWPHFRGPNLGVVTRGDYPRTWDAATNKNILWKVELPRAGKSSPVLWGNRIFLACGDATAREVLCYGRADGKLLWRTEIKMPADAQKAWADAEIEVPDGTTYAAPTPATDGERVYVTFATADLAALDFDGNVLWATHLGVPDNSYGKAPSLLACKGRVIVQNDDGMAAAEGKSGLIAFDGATGKLAWRTPRQTGATWGSPALAHTPLGPQIITTASWVIGYEPNLGVALWKARLVPEDGYAEIAPSPTYANGRAYVAQEDAVAMAIKVDGTGDVTDTHVEWEAEEGLPDTPSPLATAKYLLLVHSGGRAACYGAEAGDLLWERDLGSSLLTPSDVLDWPAFCAKLVEAGATGTPVFGKRVWDALPEPTQHTLRSAAKQPPEGEEWQTEITDVLGKALGGIKGRYLCQAEDLAGLTLPDEVGELLKEGRKRMPMSGVERLNRLVLEATLGTCIAKSYLLTGTIEASPSVVGDVVYLFDGQGRALLFELSGHYRALGVCSLGESISATPAFADSQIYVRTKKHLFCVGKKTE